MEENRTVYTGIGVGNVIAVLLSWFKWHSLLWAVIHGWLGWIYIVYYLIIYGFDFK